MSTEITQLGLRDHTYLSDDEKNSDFKCIIQILFDQHLQVNVETSGGAIFQDVFVRPYGDDFVFLNQKHRSGSEGIKGSTLVPVNQIASITFRKDRDYLMAQPR